MEFEPIDLKVLRNQFKRATENSTNEEELKIALEESMKAFFKKYDIEYDPKYEMTVVKGRVDATFGSIIIEYEKPRSLETKADRQHAINQLKDYINKLAKKSHVKQDSLLGIALDGESIIYVRWRDRWVISRRYKVNMRSLPAFLECFRGLLRKPLTSKSLTKDFGLGSKNCKQMMDILLTRLEKRSHPRTQVFFDEWKKFFSESCGYDFKKPKAKLVKLAERFGKGKNQVDQVIFCLHTYFSLILTLLASEIVSVRTKTVFEGYIEFLLNTEREKMVDSFKKMPSGGIFEYTGFKNFLEGDFFWWFTDEWSVGLGDSVYLVLRSLNKYEPAHSLIYTRDVKDVLKELYEDLIPRGVRHDLGEYYTPDWIAEYVLSNIKITEDTRILDPACGSGTFLIHIIDKIKQKFGSSMNETRLLQLIRKQVIGFDLNPVAIITARTNYLLAIADLIPFVKGDLFIPVYMTDSIASAKRMTLVGKEYFLSTSVGDFQIPVVFIESEHRLKFFSVLEEAISNDYSFDEFKGRLSENFSDRDLKLLLNLFNRFKTLEKEGKNRFWTRLLINTFAPFTIGKFDYIIGNPPWIGWEHLPPGYREATQHLWKQYNLFSIKKGSEARLGGGKKDFSMLFVHRCIDLYLKDRGELIFLITQTVFQSVKTGEGFRKFQFGGAKDITKFNVWRVDDMVKLKPFRATNQTSIIFCKKGEETKYPVNYIAWHKKRKVNLADNTLSYKDVETTHVTRHECHARLSSRKIGSPWIIYPKDDKEFPVLIKKLCGISPYVGKAGVCTWLNGVFWIKILEKYPNGKILIENLGEIGKIKVETVRAKIESDLVYPLIRGRDVKLWNIGTTENYYILVTNDPETRKGIGISKMRVNYPETYKYLKIFKKELTVRSGYKKYFRPTDPFYSIYNVEKRLFAPYRLLWSEIGEFGGSLAKEIIDPFLGKKLPVPNNKAMYIPLYNEKEALFLTGFINSPIIRKYIDAKKLVTSTTTKLMAEMKIPTYNSERHQNIVELTKKIIVDSEDKKSIEELQSFMKETLKI